MSEGGACTKIVSLGPSLGFLPHFHLAIRLQVRGNSPNLSTGVAAIQLTASHLLVVSNRVYPGGVGDCRCLFGKVDAVVYGVPGEHEHITTLLLAPNKDITICAAAKQRSTSQMNANNSAPVTAQRLHARVFAIRVPRRKHVDATIRAST
jgi:hypothetical protein